MTEEPLTPTVCTNCRTLYCPWVPEEAAQHAHHDGDPAQASGSQHSVAVASAVVAPEDDHRTHVELAQRLFQGATVVGHRPYADVRAAVLDLFRAELGHVAEPLERVAQGLRALASTIGSLQTSGRQDAATMAVRLFDELAAIAVQLQAHTIPV